MSKTETLATERDTEAMHVSVNEVLDALKPLNDEARLRVLAAVATFLGLASQLERRLYR